MTVLVTFMLIATIQSSPIDWATHQHDDWQAAMIDIIEVDCDYKNKCEVKAWNGDCTTDMKCMGKKHGFAF